MPEHHSSTPRPGSLDPRRRWNPPVVRRLKAGDAENGVINTVTDQQFSFGS